MSHESSSDPLDFVRNMWSGMGFSLPGMVTPTLDVDELEKRITDMKAVEGWLKMNLNMLQMSIQGLEMQHATLTTIKAMGEATRQKGPDAADTNDSPNNANPFNNAALWSWLQAMSGAAPEAAAQATPPSEPPASSAEGGNPFAGVAAAATNAAASAAMWPWQLMPEKAAEKKAAPAKKPAAKKPTSSARAKPAAARTPAAKKPAATPRKKT